MQKIQFWSSLYITNACVAYVPFKFTSNTWLTLKILLNREWIKHWFSKTTLLYISFRELVCYIELIHMENLLWTNYINNLKYTSTESIKTVLFSDYVDLYQIGSICRNFVNNLQIIGTSVNDWSLDRFWNISSDEHSSLTRKYRSRSVKMSSKSSTDDSHSKKNRNCVIISWS